MSAGGRAMACARGIALVGLRGHTVRVECARAPGLPGLRLVGLPDAAVREAGERIRGAIEACGLRWPRERVVVNLAPADLPKVGSGFDLPLALAVLAASGQIDRSALEGLWACGEVGLDGSVRPVAEVLPIAVAARDEGARCLMLAPAATAEAGLVDGLRAVGVADLGAAVDVLAGRREGTLVPAPATAPRAVAADLSDVRGQPVASRAVEIAAAGAHHLLLLGPPGCGKTMLARRLHGVLPSLTPAQALEVASVRALVGERVPGAPLEITPPLRAPHHTASTAALVGGGVGVPRPGEVALAHHGVLLLDELLEMPRAVLDALRQPLEQDEVTVTRVRARVRYPCRVQLVGAANPCPCGHAGASGATMRAACTCSPDRVERYRRRLSGPLQDRFDLQVRLDPVDRRALVSTSSDGATGQASSRVARRVGDARARAAARWGSGATARDVAAEALRSASGRAVQRRLADALDGLGHSARAFDRCLRVAWSIAHLDGDEDVAAAHVDEAVAYRLPPIR